MYRQVIEKAAEKMKKTTSVYQEDLRSIRAGRANPQFLERVTVDYYGCLLYTSPAYLIPDKWYCPAVCSPKSCASCRKERFTFP